jgi:hypothetical protein
LWSSFALREPLKGWCPRRLATVTLKQELNFEDTQ